MRAVTDIAAVFIDLVSELRFSKCCVSTNTK